MMSFIRSKRQADFPIEVENFTALALPNNRNTSVPISVPHGFRGSPVGPSFPPWVIAGFRPSFDSRNLRRLVRKG